MGDDLFIAIDDIVIDAGADCAFKGRFDAAKESPAFARAQPRIVKGDLILWANW